jgi:hypothetical protein
MANLRYSLLIADHPHQYTMNQLNNNRALQWNTQVMASQLIQLLADYSHQVLTNIPLLQWIVMQMVWYDCDDRSNA